MPEKTTPIQYKLHRTIPGGIRIFWWIVLIWCILNFIMALSGIFGSSDSIFALLISAGIGFIVSVILFTNNVAQIDPNLRRVRTANQFLNVYAGKWHDIEKYPDIAVLKKNIATTMYSPMAMPGGLMETTRRDVMYDVCLLTENHRKKWLVMRTDDPEKSKRVRDEVAALLQLNATTYHPVRSTPNPRRR